MKEAILYKKLADKRVRCGLCAHRCLIPEGTRGICAVRENRDGTLYSLVYGKAIAANIDPIEKKPLYHFLPGTLSYSIAAAGCNFRCSFCQNWQISQITKGPSGEIAGRDLPPEGIVKKAVRTGCQSIAYTYTEPTIFFEYAYDTARLAKERGLKNIFVTNGYQTPETIETMIGVIDAANIDLKSFSDDYYRKVCGAKLGPVLDAIKLMYQKGLRVEVTTLVVTGQNDSDGELKQIANFLVNVSPDLPWHVSRFRPDYKMNSPRPTPIETLHRAVEIGKKAGLRYIYIGNVPGDKYENTFCPRCGEVVIERFGYNAVNRLDGGGCPVCGQAMPVVRG